MAQVPIDIDVVKEYLLDGTLQNIHVIPARSTHYTIDNECWCQPTFSKALSKELYGGCSTVWMHHNYPIRRG